MPFFYLLSLRKAVGVERKVVLAWGLAVKGSVPSAGLALWQDDQICYSRLSIHSCICAPICPAASMEHHPLQPTAVGGECLHPPEANAAAVHTTCSQWHRGIMQWGPGFSQAEGAENVERGALISLGIRMLSRGPVPVGRPLEMRNGTREKGQLPPR